MLKGANLSHLWDSFQDRFSDGPLYFLPGSLPGKLQLGDLGMQKTHIKALLTAPCHTAHLVQETRLGPMEVVAQQSPRGMDWVFYFLGKAEILHVYENQVLGHLFGLQNHHWPCSSATQGTYNVKQNQCDFHSSLFPRFSLFSPVSFSLFPNQQHLFVPRSFSNPTLLPLSSVILFFPWLFHVSKPHKHSTSSELRDIFYISLESSVVFLSLPFS